VDEGAGVNKLAVDASGRITVNVNGTVTVTGTVTANAGTGNFTNASIGATASAVPASASYSGFSDGTNLQGARVKDLDSGAGNDYALEVTLRRTASGGSVELIGQATMANSIPVVIASDQSAVAVSVNAPSSAKFNMQSTAALAVGANATLNFTDITTSKIGKLMQIVVSSKSPLKIELGIFSASTLTVKVTAFTLAGQPFIFSPPTKDFINTITGAAGVNFAVKVTNNDLLDANDVFSSAAWDEV